MSWENQGTITLTTGSAFVDGAGTRFVGNVTAGQALLTPDGRLREIAEVIAATRLRLVRAYDGGSVAGVIYDIIPTSANLTEVIDRLRDLITRYRAVVDGVGQGLFPDGTLAAPGIRFAAEPGSGMRRYGANGIALVVGGQDRLFANAGGVAVPGNIDLDGNMSVTNTTKAVFANTLSLYSSVSPMTVNFSQSTYLRFIAGSDDRERMRMASDGSLSVMGDVGSRHLVSAKVPQGQGILVVEGVQGAVTAAFAAVDSYLPNGSGAALYLGRDATTLRSINATGTINASGADYAEYMVKAAGCGTIEKGDVCGVDIDGHLTRTWADARSFVVKSTDPSYVGGDTWGQSVGPRPEGPGEEPVAPVAPPSAPADDDAATVAAWEGVVAAFPTLQAAYQSARATWTAAKAAYDQALPVWQAALEAARQQVDRIAFAGQVPVNVSGDFAVGDYLIAAAQGAGIKAVAVPADTITFDQYRRRLGKVWAVRDGRAWIDVQHG